MHFMILETLVNKSKTHQWFTLNERYFAQITLQTKEDLFRYVIFQQNWGFCRLTCVPQMAQAGSCMKLTIPMSRRLLASFSMVPSDCSHTPKHGCRRLNYASIWLRTGDIEEKLFGVESVAAILKSKMAATRERISRVTHPKIQSYPKTHLGVTLYYNYRPCA
jgi:hypothetical protein